MIIAMLEFMGGWFSKTFSFSTDFVSLKDLTGVSRIGIKELIGSLKVSKKNKFMMYFNLYIWFTLTFCPYLDDKFNYHLDNNPFFFFYVAICGFLLNLWNSKSNNDYKFLKFFDFTFLNDLNFFSKMNLYYLNFQKFIFFSTNVVFLQLINIMRCIYKSIVSSFLFWNPLFKKTSYFHFYKSHSSRFFK